MRLKVAVWDLPLFCFVVIVVVSLLDSRLSRPEVHCCVTNSSLKLTERLRRLVKYSAGICTLYNIIWEKTAEWRNHVGPNLAIFYYGKIVLNQILVFFHSITSLAVVKKHS